MDHRVREAGIDDVPSLVGLMHEFYQEAGFPLPQAVAARAFEALLGDPSRGRIWLLEIDGDAVGYVVLTIGFSMEYGGLRAFVDDFFVRSSRRCRGLGTAALQTVKRCCDDLGIRALLVETGAQSPAASGVYARAGFVDTGRLLMSQALAPPIHEA